MASAHPSGDCAPFSWHGPAEDRYPLLLASPHSGRSYPQAFLAQSRLSVGELRLAEDPWVDHLLMPSVRALDLALIAANWGRSVIDLNRAADELDPEIFTSPLPAPTGDSAQRIAAGLGVLPRIAAPGLEIYRTRLSLEDADWRLRTAHRPYHGHIQQRLEAQQRQYGLAILMDCHSMPSLPRTSGGRVDIVLGNRYGQSCGDFLLDRLTELFTQLGLKVGHNHPYAGGYTTHYHGRPHHNIHAIQIEMDRNLYMDVRTRQPHGQFASVAQGLQDILTIFCAELATATPPALAAE